MFDEFRHALTPVKICNGSNNCRTFSLSASKSYGIRKLFIGNINSRFHDGKIANIRFLIKYK